MKRAILLLWLVALPLPAGGCSDDKPRTVAGPTLSEDGLKRDCNDPKWKDQNLGLWYSVCRKPMRW